MTKRGDEHEQAGAADGAERAAEERDPDGRDAAARAISRRRFVGLIAAGAGATLAPAALAATPTTRRKGDKGGAAKPAETDAPTPRVAKGLEEQRASLAHTLKTIREFELPTGSEQGFAFRPLPARRNP